MRERDDITQDKLDFAIKRVMRLDEKVDKLGRFDWKQQFLGMLFEFGVRFALQSQATHDMVAFAVGALGSGTTPLLR